MYLNEEYLKFERENELYDLELFGFKYWEYVRVYIYTELKVKTERLSGCVENSKKKISNYFINLKDFNKYLGFKKIKNHDLLFLSHPRRILQNGEYENIYLDGIINNLKKKYSCLTIEEPSWVSHIPLKTGHFYPVKTKNIIFTDLYELEFIIKKNLFIFFCRRKYNFICKTIDELFTDLGEHFNVDLLGARGLVIKTILYGIIMKKKYTSLINKISPKAVLINYWPTDFKTMIVDICNSLNIPTIEIQHGIVSKDGIFYKSYDKTKCKKTSKYYFSFGEIHSKKEYLTTKEESNIINVGFPFLESKINQKYELPKYLEQGKRYILIISQPILGETLSDFASNLSELLKDKNNYKIIFKYHPNEIHRNYKNLQKDNIIQIKEQGIDIYQYQKFSYVQVGVYSTSIYEGLAFKLPTFILDNNNLSQEPKELLNNFKKGIYYIKDAKELYSYLDKKIQKPEETDIRKLWNNNALYNISKNIDKIMEEYYE